MLITSWSIMRIRQRYFSITPKDSKVKQVKEYSVAGARWSGLHAEYGGQRPSDLISAIVETLNPVELQSDPIYTHLGGTGPNKVNAIKNPFTLKKAFKKSGQSDSLLKQLVEMKTINWIQMRLVKRAFIKKIDDNKAAVLLGFLTSIVIMEWSSMMSSQTAHVV